MPIEAWRNETPELEEDPWRSDHDRGQEAQLHVRAEGLERLRCLHLALTALVERGRYRGDDEGEHSIAEVERDRHDRNQTHQPDDHAPAQFLKVVAQRHQVREVGHLRHGEEHRRCSHESPCAGLLLRHGSGRSDARAGPTCRSVMRT